MRIRSGSIFRDGRFATGDLYIRDGRFVDPSDAVDDGIDVDATGCLVAPGLVDIHFHGCRGVDFCDADPASLDTIARYEASRGVTSICPATMTYPEDTLTAVMTCAAGWQAPDDGAALVGINMEGPFISPDKVGAQNPAYVRSCDVEEFDRLQAAAGGLISLVDVAPETQGAIDFIERVHDRVRVSIAHTCADYDTARRAIDAGARQMTHLFNAMPPLHHRMPGPISAAAESDDVVAELICDGVHVHPAMIRTAFTLFGAERIALISDSMMATGMDDGDWSLGGQPVHVENGRATLADGTIAGSSTDLASCLRIAVTQMDIPLETALSCATEVPARAIDVFDLVGSIAPGKSADAVIFDTDLNVKDVVVRGMRIARD